MLARIVSTAGNSLRGKDRRARMAGRHQSSSVQPFFHNGNKRQRVATLASSLDVALESRVLLAASFGFNFTTIASNLSTDPAQRFFGSPNASDSPFTIIRSGEGTVTTITGLPGTDGVTTAPGDLTFSFGSNDVSNPVEVVTLSSFDDGTGDGLANQVYTPDGVDDVPALTVFNSGVAVATGEVLKISLETTMASVVTSPASKPSQFKLTAAVGADTTIFDELMAATGGTGIVDFSLSAFNLTGPWAGVGDAEIFTSTGTSLNLIDPPANTPPVVDLNGGGAGTSYTIELSGPEVAIVDSTELTVVDTDSPTLSGASATITNLQAGDTLAVTDGSGITSTFAAGILTLTGSATPDAYQTVLRTLVFSTTSSNTTSRTIDVKANDGIADSVVATATVTFPMVTNTPPVIDLNGPDAPETGFSAEFTASPFPIVDSAALTVIDTDSATLSSARATITNAQPGDTLDVDLTGIVGIAKNFDGNVLSLTGDASPAEYQAALRTLTFSRTSDTTTRTIDVQVNDGTVDSVVATATVTFAPTSTAPVVDLNGSAVDGTGFTAQFTTGPLAIVDPAALTVVDTDTPTLLNATATLTNFQPGDTLAVTDGSGITGVFANGILTLTGDAPPADYQTVLRTLVFNTTSTDTTTRSINVRASDGTPGPVATATVTFSASPPAPVVDLNGADPGTGFTAQFSTGPLSIVAATATVTDADSANLSGATATLTNFQTGDTLSVTESGGITSAFAGGVLTLSGSASPDAYQTVLRTLVFNTTSTDKTTRTIDVKANDGTSDSAIATATVTFPGPVGTGDLTGDGKVDSTDGFLVVLIDAGASDETINRLKGSSTLTAAEIRQRLTTSTVLDVNEDGKTDSTDGFLVVLVDSSASLDTINRLKFNDAITGQKVQSNVQALLNGTVTATASGFLAAAAVGPTQVITASSNVTEAKAGDTIEVQVNYSTLNSPTDPSNQNVQNLALRLHYDSTQMTFKGFKAVAGGGFDILADGLTQPDPGGLGNLGAFLNGEDDTSNFDIAEDTTGTGTNKFFNVIWGKAAGGFPPGAEPVKLYTAVFEATAAFKGAEVNFSAAKTANSFSLQSNSLAIADSTAPKQVITVGPPPGSATIFAAAGVGQTVEVPVFYSTQNSPTTPTNQNVQNLALRLHYDSTQLTFKGFKAIAGGGFDILTDGLTQPDPGGLGNLGTFLNGEDDTTNFDSANDATGTETNKFFNVIWGKAAGGFPLGTEPVKLYTAVFETTAAYTSSTEINFSAAKTANGFSLLSSSAAINTVPIGPAPTANADGPFNVQTGKTITGNVLTNDNDNGAPPLTAALKTNVTNGTLVLNSDGSFTYTPNAGYIGSDSFVYTATNANGSADATVSLNVTAVPNITGNGNVRVIYRHGNLRIVGDKYSNSLQITGDGTKITLQGLGSTTINGSANPYVIHASHISGAVHINMGKGHDTVGIKDLAAAGIIGVILGQGDDILELNRIQTGKDLRVNGGSGNDRVSILNSAVSRNIVLFGARGNDQVGLSGTANGNNLRAFGGSGHDAIIVDNSTVGGNAVFFGGSGDDSIGMDATTIADNLKLNGGRGTDVGQIALNNSIGGLISVNGAAAADPSDPLFAQYRDDLFNSLLFP
jgi:hypothetical protein